MKNLTISESDKIRLGNWISREKSNAEFHFIIRDLESVKFSICTVVAIYRFCPLFGKNFKFTQVLQGIYNNPGYYQIGKIPL